MTEQENMMILIACWILLSVGLYAWAFSLSEERAFSLGVALTWPLLLVIGLVALVCLAPYLWIKAYREAP